MTYMSSSMTKSSYLVVTLMSCPKSGMMIYFSL